MKNRTFDYLGRRWHLNDNRAFISSANYEFFPRWKLLVYDECDDNWLEAGCCAETKKEAKDWIKHNKARFM